MTGENKIELKVKLLFKIFFVDVAIFLTVVCFRNSINEKKSCSKDKDTIVTVDATNCHNCQLQLQFSLIFKFFDALFISII